MAQDVSTLVSPSTLSTLSKTSPTTFGDQVVKAGAAAALTYALTNPLIKLEQQKTDLILQGQQITAKYNSAVNVLDPNSPTYANDKATLDSNYQKAISNNNTAKAKNQSDIDNYLKDPFKKQKDALTKRKNNRSISKSQTQAQKSAAQKAKNQAVLQNAAKTLAPILALALTNAIANVIAQNDTIKKLVNDTNTIITNANISNDTVQLNNAKVTRDNAVKVISNNEAKINNLQQQISQISVYISIFSIIVSVLSAILSAIPVPTPPGIVSRLLQLLEKANKLVLALSAFLPAILVSLSRAVTILENYKSQLLTINGTLDTSAANNPDLNTLLNNSFGSGFGSYKGFTFAVKQDNNTQYIIAGNYRHYAIAYNSSNVPTLRSDYSYTLDPNDLIEQLKLQIDQQNLQG
jgi:hypothetical protein